MKTKLIIFIILLLCISVIFTACGRILCGDPDQDQSLLIKIRRNGGTPISPFAFGNSYFNWVDWNNNSMDAIQGTEEPVRALKLNIIAGGNNQNDINAPQLFDEKQMDKYIEYCRAVGAEPIMIVPVYGNNIDGGQTTAQGAADIVTYINGTKKYGVKYWNIGWESDIYDHFFKTETGHRVSNVNEYIEIWNSYAQAMTDANDAVNSGVELQFIGPELGWRYYENNDWLSPMLKECKNNINIASIHHYGFAAKDLTVENIFTDVDKFRSLIRDLKDRIAKHGNPNTPLAVTSANICYDWHPDLYTEETRKLGPGTFYAAIWDADRMGAALEEGLWSFIFWNIAETVQQKDETVFGFLHTDPSKNPPTCEFTPEYYTQKMVTENFSGTTVIPTGVPANTSVYASYDVQKASTAILIINKDTLEKNLTFALDNFPQFSIKFSPMSINIIKIFDNIEEGHKLIEYTIEMAEEGLPPKIIN